MKGKKGKEKPIGRQIQHWFLVLIIFIISINLVGIMGVFQIRRRLNSIIYRHQPIVMLCEGIYEHTLLAQIETYRYLAGYTPDTKPLTPHLDKINDLIDKSPELQLSPALNEKIQKIGNILKKYIESINILEKTVSWDQKDQIQANILIMGKEIMDIASRSKEQAYNEISENNDLSHQTIKRVFFLFLVLLGVSIVIAFFEYRWWGKLQEIFLKL